MGSFIHQLQVVHRILLIISTATSVQVVVTMFWTLVKHVTVAWIVIHLLVPAPQAIAQRKTIGTELVVFQHLSTVRGIFGEIGKNVRHSAGL